MPFGFVVVHVRRDLLWCPCGSVIEHTLGSLLWRPGGMLLNTSWGVCYDTLGVCDNVVGVHWTDVLCLHVRAGVVGDCQRRDAAFLLAICCVDRRPSLTCIQDASCGRSMTSSPLSAMSPAVSHLISATYWLGKKWLRNCLTLSMVHCWQRFLRKIYRAFLLRVKIVARFMLDMSRTAFSRYVSCQIDQPLHFSSLLFLPHDA